MCAFVVMQKPSDFCLDKYLSHQIARLCGSLKCLFEIRVLKIYLQVHLLLFIVSSSILCLHLKKKTARELKTNLLSVLSFLERFLETYFIAYPLINCSTKEITLTCGRYYVS